MVTSRLTGNFPRSPVDCDSSSCSRETGSPRWKSSREWNLSLRGNSQRLTSLQPRQRIRIALPSFWSPLRLWLSQAASWKIWMTSWREPRRPIPDLQQVAAVDCDGFQTSTGPANFRRSWSSTLQNHSYDSRKTPSIRPPAGTIYGAKWRLGARNSDEHISSLVHRIFNGGMFIFDEMERVTGRT